MPETTHAFLLLIACPLAWVAFDVVRKGLAGVGRATTVTFVIAVLQVPAVVVWAWVDSALAPGAFAPGSLPPSGYWPYGLGALTVGVLGTLAFQHAVRLSPISATVPLLSLTPVFSAMLGAAFLDEIPTPRAWLGIAIAVLGAWLINVGGDSRPWTLVRDLRAEPGSGFMIVAALFFSVAPLLDKSALRWVSLPIHALVVIAGVALVLGVQLALSGRLAEVRALADRPVLVLAGGATSLLAFALQLAAVQVVWVGLLETAKRAIGAVAALILGVALFDEQASGIRVVAVIVLAIGVALVVNP